MTSQIIKVRNEDSVTMDIKTTNDCVQNKPTNYFSHHLISQYFFVILIELSLQTFQLAVETEFP